MSFRMPQHPGPVLGPESLARKLAHWNSTQVGEKWFRLNDQNCPFRHLICAATGRPWGAYSQVATSHSKASSRLSNAGRMRLEYAVKSS